MIDTKIKVEGLVQGVGFRPFVFKLALKLNLKGYVNNDDSGVNILLQGNDEDIETFLNELNINPPVLSNITSITKSKIETTDFYTTFLIIQSKSSSNKTTNVSPDIAICQNCINDINSSENYRFEYSLTNCTNCGPRYSIINTVPYDRVNTSMNKFAMCETCEDEYEDPTNRRYHAQPVSCEKCGPEIVLYDKHDEEIKKGLDAIKELAKQINMGKIVAIKGLGGFHLICDATNDNAVEELRIRKKTSNETFCCDV